jgi:hypothetical protein
MDFTPGTFARAVGSPETFRGRSREIFGEHYEKHVIGAAAVAALTIAVGDGVAVAQQSGQDQTPAAQRMEKGQGQRDQAQGQQNRTGGAQRDEAAQAQMNQQQEALKRDHTAKPGMQKEKEAKGKAAEGQQSQGERRPDQEQSEKPMRSEERTGQAQPEKRETSKAQPATENRSVETEKPNRGEQQTGQAPEPQNRAGSAANAQTGAESDQNQRRSAGQTSASLAQGRGGVRAEGAAHISNESASRIAESLRTTASPQNVNINVSVGALLPGEVDLRPLPSGFAAALNILDSHR